MLAGAILMAVLAASFVARPGPALADANEVSISPAGIEVAPGGSATVQLVAEPPVETLAIWAIDVVFDPDVVTTTSRGCDTLDPPPDTTTIGSCVLDDEDEDGAEETVIVLGAVVFNDDSGGLKERTVLADITFTAVGSLGTCTELRLRIRIYADISADEEDDLAPSLFDGRICIEQDAPPAGTAVPHTPAPRTSEPTPTGGGGPTLTLPPLASVRPASGDETPAGGPDAGPPGQTASQTPTVAVGGEDGGGGGGGDGDGVLILILAVVGALIAAAGVAWAVVRRRGAGSGPEDGPSAG